VSEVAWVVGDFGQLLEQAGRVATARKRRLFACAVARHLGEPRRGRLYFPLFEAAVEVAERYADGAADAEELARAHRSIRHCRSRLTQPTVLDDALALTAPPPWDLARVGRGWPCSATSSATCFAPSRSMPPG
jgi:hypothetical protein